MYKPTDIFINIVDLFAIFIPGGIFCYVIYAYHTSALNSIFQLNGSQYWIAFLFFSFFIGHVISYFAEGIDKSWSSNSRISKNEALWEAVYDIRYSIGVDSDSDSSIINIYQWCRSILITVSPDAMADINRIVASADFFRNLYVVFPITGILGFISSNYKLGILFIVLAFISVCFSQTSRYKLHKRICYYIIVLYSLGKLKD